MRTEIDINTWNRKEIFYHFLNFGMPFCGVTVNIDITNLYNEAKREGESFFLYEMFLFLKAANNCEPMRMNIIDGHLYMNDKIGIAPTVGRTDGTVGFAYIPYSESREDFIKNANEIMEVVKGREGLCFDLQPKEVDCALFFSTEPWFTFSNMKNPFPLNPNDSNPRVTTGRFFEQDGRLMLPVEIDVHHSLMDAFHIATYIYELNRLLGNRATPPRM